MLKPILLISAFAAVLSGGATANAAITANAITANAITANAITANALTNNAITANAITASGARTISVRGGAQAVRNEPLAVAPAIISVRLADGTVAPSR